MLIHQRLKVNGIEVKNGDFSAAVFGNPRKRISSSPETTFPCRKQQLFRVIIGVRKGEEEETVAR
jgi:hypothetical protein